MTSVTLALLFTAMFAGGASAYFVTISTVEEQIEFAGQSLVYSLSGSIVTIINRPGAEGELQMALNKMLALDVDQRIGDALVISKELRVLAAKDPSQVGRTFSRFAGLEQVRSIQVVRLPAAGTRIVSPVQWGRANKYTLGYVILTLGEAAYTKARNDILLSFALVFLVALLATVWITRWVLQRLLRPVVELGEAARALAAGNSDYPLEPRSADEIGVATQSFLAMRDAQKIFVRFSNPALVEEILAGRVPEHPHEVKLVVGFGDGVRFTNWSSAHTAGEISARLSDYFTLFGQLVAGHNGIVEKFIGDAVMSYFGLHTQLGAQPTARQALRAHVYGQVLLAFANRAFRRYHRRLILEFRFGLATGKCVVGPMGAYGIKLDYTLIGDTVNLASRLEGLAEPCGLAIDNFTYLDAEAESFLHCDGPEQQQIKGFEREVPMFRVLGFTAPEENERLRATVLDLFRGEAAGDVMRLTNEQNAEFLSEVEAELGLRQVRLPMSSTEWQAPKR